MKDELMVNFFSKDINKETLINNFKRLVEKLEFNNEFEITSPIGVGGIGREGRIIKISKPKWRGELMELINGLYSINENTFNIHYEMGFDILNKTFSIPLHYESNEYVPKGKLINNSKKEDYSRYINRRNKVKKIIHDEIKKLNNDNLKPYNGSNTIISTKVYIDNTTTVNDFNKKINEIINLSSSIVDKAIKLYVI